MRRKEGREEKETLSENFWSRCRCSDVRDEERASYDQRSTPGVWVGRIGVTRTFDNFSCRCLSRRLLTRILASTAYSSDITVPYIETLVRDPGNLWIARRSSRKCNLGLCIGCKKDCQLLRQDVRGGR